MEHDVLPFSEFFPGNHLILGAAGVGKTRLVWSLLQSNEFHGEGKINIFLTHSDERIKQEPLHQSIKVIDPYSIDMRWIANPLESGTYYAACDYIPRVITFLECLANFARSSEGNQKKQIRVFIDYPAKFWRDPCFLEQFNRLNYISDTLNDNESFLLETWTVLTASKETILKSSQLKSPHFIILNPLNETWLHEVSFLFENRISITDLFENSTNSEGSYIYIPNNKKKDLYLSAQNVF